MSMQGEPTESIIHWADADGRSWEVQQFVENWTRRWPSHAPADFGDYRAHGLSHLRLHSLPQSKEYPESGVEYAELLHRHSVTLEHLVHHTGTNPADPLLLMTSSASGSADPVSRDRWLDHLVPSTLLCSYRSEVDPEDSAEIWGHTYVREVNRGDDALTSTLVLVADGVAWGVAIAPASLEWVYVPYTGGADVLGAPEPVLAELRDLHPDWLPISSANRWRAAPPSDTPGWEFRSAHMPEATARRLAEVAESEDLLLTNGYVVDPRRELTIGLDRTTAQLLRILLTGAPGEVYDSTSDVLVHVTPVDAARRIQESTALDLDLDEFLMEYGYRQPAEALDGAIPGHLWDPESDYSGVRDA